MTEFALQPQNIAQFISAKATDSAAAAYKAYMRNVANPGSLSESYLRRLTNDVVVDMILWRDSGNPMPSNELEELRAAVAELPEVSVSEPVPA
jgi:hypothetical protein